MLVAVAIGLGIAVIAAVVVGVQLFGHREPAAVTVRSASGAPAGATAMSTAPRDVTISLGRRLTSLLLLLGLTLGLAGLLAAVVGTVVFLGGLAMGS